MLEGSSNLFLLAGFLTIKKSYLQKRPEILALQIADYVRTAQQGNFMSYIVIFKKEQPFTESEVEMLKLVEKDILICYENFLKGWNMK